jgi:2-methylisocitrate lyase-like PEP mutase family enzyme
VLGDYTAAQLEAIGFRVAIYPGLARNAAGFGIRHALGALKRDGNTKSARSQMLTFKEYNEVLGLADVEAWEQRFLQR